MESDEQIELTSKIETDSQRAGDSYGVGRLEGGRWRKKKKRTHGHKQQGGDCIKLEHSFTETIQMIQKATAMGN